MINIDLKKAFDGVDHEFLFKIMEKMGFSQRFISWIKILYNDIQSSVLINGHLGNFFNVNRGVRQGCPLSMILYVISQEPLYQAIKQTKQIAPLDIPCKPIKLLGYADDTTFFVKSDIGIIYVFTLIKHFEIASGIKLNYHKTKIFGFGLWHGRRYWPYDNIKIESKEITNLGITYAININDAV